MGHQHGRQENAARQGQYVQNQVGNDQDPEQNYVRDECH